MIKLMVNSNVSVNISEPNELLELMTGDDKIQLIESLSCHDEVIQHVVDQISHLHGCTENGHSGWSSKVMGSTVLDKARADIAISSSKLAEDAIKSLQDTIKRNELQITELYAKLNNERY